MFYCLFSGFDMAIAALTLSPPANLRYPMSSVDSLCPAKGDRTNRLPNPNIHCGAAALTHPYTQKRTPDLAYAGPGVCRLNQFSLGGGDFGFRGW